MIKKAKRRLLSLLTLSFLVACTKTPVTGENVFILTSEAQEAQLGQEAYQQILSKSRLSTNTSWTDIVNRVGVRISGAAQQPKFRWEFNLIESKEKNAFCLPGGKVAVYTGLLENLANEAQLAAVLGHEVAHATARHAGQRITLQFGAEIGFLALAELIGGTDTAEKRILMQTLGVGATVGAVLPFSRKHETEADYLGQIYMATAGYDPNAAVSLWQALADDASKAPELLSTHPAPQRRLEALRQHLPKALETYQESFRYGLGELFPPRLPAI